MHWLRDRITHTQSTTLAHTRHAHTSAVLPSRRRTSAIVMLVLLALSVLTPNIGTRQAQAQAWSLTTAQRQAYLQYYAPVILKRGDENEGRAGREWITNYDFDQDGNFANNRVNWSNVPQYVAASASQTGAYRHWRIRPTLYTSLIEYMNGGSKSVVLLYHVYHASDKNGNEIHDWERVEIVVHGISGTPGGSSEYVNHATVTLHKEHHMRRYYDSALNFMHTATGKHLLIWQADENNWETALTSPHAHELRFVTNPYSWIANQAYYGAQAEVNISSKDDKRNVHYVFVPEGSSSAVSTWGAQALNYANAGYSASRVDDDNTIGWYQVKRLTYELQDLADIFPTHWQGNQWYTHWTDDDQRSILLESPIVNEAGQPEVSAGLQIFNVRSRDIGKSGGVGADAAVLGKNPIWGNYSAELEPELKSGSDNFQGYEGIGTDSYGRTRGAASGYYNSHNAFWWQHDFFVHSGVMNFDNTREEGMWLPGAWYTAANGGFDGRWVQLFDDRPSYEAPAPPPPPPSEPTDPPPPPCDVRFCEDQPLGDVKADPLSPTQ